MQRSSGASACASCKHQRKKCTDKCPLAPFFPIEKSREFRAVHRVFGVSNVTKLVTALMEEDRKVAVDSLVWEALCRQRDPVLGPYGDYRRVCEELRLYKSQYQQGAAQGGVVYKAAAAAQGIMGWGNSSKVVNNSNNGASNFCPYGYPTNNHHVHQDGEKMRAERENVAAVVMPQQHLGNGFNQQFFIAGQYNHMDSKSLESTLWEGSS